jgi:ferric-dicitrate binding protein FerR (iron transport regulator)
MPTCSQRNIAARSGLVEGHPEHAALWVQARERWPRQADLAALPRAQERSAHGQVHRNGARPILLTGGGKFDQDPALA